MPGVAVRRLCSTSAMLLPIEDTIPIPVTTTRLMPVRSPCCSGLLCGHQGRKKPDAEVLCFGDKVAVGFHKPLGDPQCDLRADNAADVDTILHLIDVVGDLSREFDLADAECPSLAGR